MFDIEKVHDLIFGNPIVNECNEILHSCKTKDGRMRVAALIRSKAKLDSISGALLNRGKIEAIIWLLYISYIHIMTLIKLV